MKNPSVSDMVPRRRWLSASDYNKVLFCHPRLDLEAQLNVCTWLDYRRANYEDLMALKNLDRKVVRMEAVSRGMSIIDKMNGVHLGGVVFKKNFD